MTKSKAFRVLARNKNGDMVADFIFHCRIEAKKFQEGMKAKGNTTSITEMVV